MTSVIQLGMLNEVAKAKKKAAHAIGDYPGAIVFAKRGGCHAHLYCTCGEMIAVDYAVPDALMVNRLLEEAYKRHCGVLNPRNDYGRLA